MKKLILMMSLAIILLSSCSKEDYSESIDVSEKSGTLSKEPYLMSFANILSKVVYERKDVREFLKKESLKQFDKNYDILYYLIKDQNISGKSFRDILISYSSKEAIETIETNVPLLNILLPEIPMFNIHPEKLDVNDKEIPVAVSKKEETVMFFNGKKDVCLDKGEVPGFHVFVVNENSRVIEPDIRTEKFKSGNTKVIKFKSPNYDGSTKNQIDLREKSMWVNANHVGQKAIDAYKYFYKDDGSGFQKGFQRDYVYYGITPENQAGSLNRSVTEYISFVEIDPNGYFTFADQRTKDIPTHDPFIINTETSQKKRSLSEDELISRLWTEGAYNFRIVVMRSTNNFPDVHFLPLKPSEIWNFNIDHSYRHSTTFRHSKHTYRIDPNKFTAKKVYLDNKVISLGKWNISEEALIRAIEITEEDDADLTYDYSYTYEEGRVKTDNFKGDLKLGMGLFKDKVNVNGSVSTDITSTNTITEKRTINLSRKEKSDLLGTVRIYFYDSLIEGKDEQTGEYLMHTYMAGPMKFGISVK